MTFKKSLARNSAIAMSMLSMAVISAHAQAELTKRFIVKYPSASESRTMSAQGVDVMAAQQQMLARGDVAYQRSMLLDGYHVISVKAGSEEELAQRIEELSNSPAIAHIEEDAIMRAFAAPNDPRYADQWHYFDQQAGINLPNAWERATGKGVTVAVLDTGYRPHKDLVDNLLPGYDMITETFYSVDGDGRDSDARDPGDHMKQGECDGSYPPRDFDSSWHGTHVAGTIAATTNNGIGVAGVAYDAKVVPVRVLGKCGGRLSDIADGIYWAAGGSVRGVPANQNPAQVINMSLGGRGNCDGIYQEAINFARSQGATVVVAAGNSNDNAANYRPSNCAGVVNVAASNINAAKANYSNYGSVVDVTAPGGEWRRRADGSVFVNDPQGVLSTDNTGDTTPGSDAYFTSPGTSMAAPHIAGVVAMMYEVKPDITPTEVENILKNRANTTALTDNCTGCGSGIIDADKAVAEAAGGVIDPIGGSETFEVADYYRWWFWDFGQPTLSYTVTTPEGMTSLEVVASGTSGNGSLTVFNAQGEGCTGDISGAVGSCSVSDPSAGDWTIRISTGYRSDMSLTATWK
ncbi:extracellular protease [Bacterioplanes sanyensis]|uniref:S8 family peptidase n=1 Tax=Bacterioplanes sanyensis TaxID=1249553 RepID=UPI001676364B|nr:S8 family peptidase [Bacterioplanes sanyensis]GGY59358.1 extracellular protease [Bacterioplanes sanyensis]